MRPHPDRKPFDLGADAFEAGEPLSANPFRDTDDNHDARAWAAAWAAGWMDASSRDGIHPPHLASDPPPSGSSATGARGSETSAATPESSPMHWLARVLAFCAAWYASVRAARAREASSLAWAEAERWTAFAALFRAVAKRPSFRTLAHALGMHLPPERG
jgi:hypothetical protein